MNTLFRNSKNSKKFDPHRLLLNLTDKIKKKLTKTLAFTIHGKI